MSNHSSSKSEGTLYAVFSEPPFIGNVAQIVPIENEHDDSQSDKQIELGDPIKSLTPSAVCYIETYQTPIHCRWFNQHSEIQFCGHAALAAAAYLDSHRLLDKQTSLYFPAGKYSLRKARGLYWFADDSDYPLEQINQTEINPLVDTKIKQAYQCLGESGYFMLRLSDNLDLKKVTVDIDALEQRSKRALIITSAQTKNTSLDYTIRYFAPQYGINEDSATGSANRIAAEYWLRITGKTSLRGYQASKEGGIIYSERYDDKIWVGANVQAIS